MKYICSILFSLLLFVSCTSETQYAYVAHSDVYNSDSVFVQHYDYTSVDVFDDYSTMLTSFRSMFRDSITCLRLSDSLYMEFPSDYIVKTSLDVLQFVDKWKYSKLTRVNSIYGFKQKGSDTYFKMSRYNDKEYRIICYKISDDSKIAYNVSDKEYFLGYT